MKTKGKIDDFNKLILELNLTRNLMPVKFQWLLTCIIPTIVLFEIMF